MLIVLGCMCLGVLSGYLLRTRNIRFQNGLILTLIWVLLFLLGLEVGTNTAVVQKFATLGIEAMVIAVAATLGSITAAKLLWRKTAKPAKKNIIN